MYVKSTIWIGSVRSHKWEGFPLPVTVSQQTTNHLINQ